MDLMKDCKSDVPLFLGVEWYVSEVEAKRSFALRKFPAGMKEQSHLVYGI